MFITSIYRCSDEATTRTDLSGHYLLLTENWSNVLDERGGDTSRLAPIINLHLGAMGVPFSSDGDLRNFLCDFHNVNGHALAIP